MLYFLACLYISFYYIRPTEWVPGIIGMPLLYVLGLMSVGTLVFAVLEGSIRIPKNNQEKMFLGYIATIILSHVSHAYLQGTIDSITTNIPLYVGFLLISSAIDTRGRYDKFVLLLIVLSTFLGYEGWLQHTTGISHGEMTPIFEPTINSAGEKDVVSRVRWHGVFSDPNDLGLTLVMIVPFLLNMVFTKRFLLPLLCLPPVLSAIYYTNSRGAGLAFLAVIMSFFTIRYRSTRGVVVGLILASIIFTVGPSRMATLSSGGSASHERLELWHAGFQMFKSAPLFGVGQNMFMNAMPQTAHNSFVLVMAELGLLGLFCFTGIIYFPINWLWRNVFRNQDIHFSSEEIGRLSAVFSSLIGLLVAMFFLSRSYVLVPFIYMVLAAASTRLCVSLNESVVDHIPMKQHLKNIAVITVGQIIFINIMVKVFIR